MDHTCHGGMNPPFPGPCSLCEIERRDDEIERLRNKLNADSQNFELECRKAQIERLEAQLAEAQHALRIATAEVLVREKRCGTCADWATSYPINHCEGRESDHNGISCRASERRKVTP